MKRWWNIVLAETVLETTTETDAEGIACIAVVCRLSSSHCEIPMWFKQHSDDEHEMDSLNSSSLKMIGPQKVDLPIVVISFSGSPICGAIEICASFNMNNVRYGVRYDAHHLRKPGKPRRKHTADQVDQPGFDRLLKYLFKLGYKL